MFRMPLTSSPHRIYTPSKLVWNLPATFQVDGLINFADNVQHVMKCLNQAAQEGKSYCFSPIIL